MSWLLYALTEAYASADELTRPHLDEYDGDTFTTPSLIDKEDHGEA